MSFTHLDGKLLRIWQANLVDEQSDAEAGFIIQHNKEGVFVSCGDGVLQVTELQFAGKNKSSAAQALNGRNLTGLSFN